MDGLIFFVTPILLLIALFVVFFRIERRRQAGTGVDVWIAVASTLPWRDRWTLYRANRRGRAAPDRLAGLAVQRGLAMIAEMEQAVSRESLLRKPWRWMVVLGVFMVALSVWELANDILVASAWLNLVIWIPLTGLCAGMGRLQRRQLRLLRRSVQLKQGARRPRHRLTPRSRASASTAFMIGEDPSARVDGSSPMTVKWHTLGVDDLCARIGRG